MENQAAPGGGLEKSDEPIKRELKICSGGR
jgi:hypothetical protein